MIWRQGGSCGWWLVRLALADTDGQLPGSNRRLAKPTDDIPSLPTLMMERRTLARSLLIGRFSLHAVLALVLSVYGANSAKYTNPADTVNHVSLVFHPALQGYPTNASQLEQKDTMFWRSCDECFNRHLGCSKAKSGDKAWTCVKDHY